MKIFQIKCNSCGAPININQLSHIHDLKIECPHCHSVFIKEAKHSKIGAEKEAEIELLQKKEMWNYKKLKNESDIKKEESRNELKIILILCSFLILFFMMAGICLQISTRDSIEVTEVNKVFRGKNYKEIRTQLNDMGFQNIKVVKIEDLKLGFLKKDGEVEKVTINGKSDFESGDTFKSNSKVKILYHTFRECKINCVSC